MNEDKIWLLVGDDYEPQSFSPNTPCTKCHGGISIPSGDPILPLKEAVEHFKGEELLVYSGNGCWLIACPAREEYCDIKLRLTFNKGHKIDKQKLIDAIYEVLNGKTTKEKLPDVTHFSPYIR